MRSWLVAYLLSQYLGIVSTRAWTFQVLSKRRRPPQLDGLVRNFRTMPLPSYAGSSSHGRSITTGGVRTTQILATSAVSTSVDEDDDDLINELLADDDDDNDFDGVSIDGDDREFTENLNKNRTVNPHPLALQNLANLSQNVTYFYLRDEVGVDEATLWKITFEAGSALEMHASTIRHKLQVLRDILHVSNDDIQVILAKQPTILHLSADQNLAPTLLFWLRALAMGRDELRALVLACPAVLCYRVATLHTKLHFFTQLLGSSVDECRNLLLREPRLCRCSVRTSLVPKMRFLVRDLEFDKSQLRTLVLKHPQLFLYSLDNNLIPKLVYFGIMTLELSLPQLRQLVLQYPQFMTYNLDRHLLPIVYYFVNDLQWPMSGVRRMIIACPRILSYSVAKLKTMTGHLRYQVGLDAHQVQQLVERNPQVLGLQTKSVDEKIAFLTDQFALQPVELRQVVVQAPALLGLSLEKNLCPKAVLLQSMVGGNTTSLLHDLVLRNPFVLCYSIHRLRPRLQDLRDNALLTSATVAMALPLTEQRYQVWLRNRISKEKKRQRQSSAIVLQPSPGRASVAVDERIMTWTRPRRPEGRHS